MIEIDEATKQLLQKFGFEPRADQPKLFWKSIDDRTEAFIDFRKQNGRRFAQRDGEFVEDEDSIEILKQFKEERDKLLQSSSAAGGREQNINNCSTPDTLKSSGDVFERQNNNIAGDTSQSSSKDVVQSHEAKRTLDNGMEPETVLNNQSSIHTPPEVKTFPAPNSPNLYEFFYELVGAGGIIEIFGDTGTLKSNLCTEVCRDAEKINKRFYYLDTEGKVGLFNKKYLGKNYTYQPIWTDIVESVKKMPKYDLVIIDSIGFPISAKSAGMKLNEQGQAWNDMMSLVGDHLKAWAFKNNAVAIITNQPKSDFMKEEEELKFLGAVGDKVHFAPNLILKSHKSRLKGYYDEKSKKVVPPKSLGTFTSFRSTDFKDELPMLLLTKNDEDVEAEIPKEVVERLKKLRK